MKTPLLLYCVSLFAMAGASAQTYSASKNVDIFGDTSVTYKDAETKTTTVVKKSTDIFGNETSTTTTFGDKKVTRRYVRLFDALEGRIDTNTIKVY